MANEAFVDGIMADINGSAEQAYRAVGPEVEAYAVQLVSVPVGRQGSKIIRSKPGEPPRKETGGVAGGIGHEVRRDAEDQPTLIVYAIGAVAGYLTDGTSRMAKRPFMEPTFDRWAEPVCDRVADAVGRR